MFVCSKWTAVWRAGAVCTVMADGERAAVPTRRQSCLVCMYGEVENTMYRSCIFSENALIDSIPRISIKEPTEIIHLLCDILHCLQI